MTKRILHGLVLDKIAAVDRPCQEGAQMAIIKRDFSDDRRKELAASGAALPDGSFPIENGSDLDNAIHAIGRAKDPAKAKAHIKTRAKALGLTDKIPEEWGMTKFQKAMQFLKDSVTSIIEDDRATNKAELVTKSIGEFQEHVEKEIPEIGKGAGAADATIVDTGATMSEAVKKALGLPATATEAEITAAITKRDEDTAKVAKELAIAKMSDKHKGFMDKGGKMPSGGKDAFAAMSPAERDTHCAANPMDDDVTKALATGNAFEAINGAVITKGAAGAMFDVLKAQDAEIRKNRDDLAKSAEEKAVSTFEKRATDLGFESTFGATMRKAYGGDAAAQAEVEKKMAALKKQADEGGVFTEFGKRTATGGKAYDELLAKAEELRKTNPKLKKAQAFDRVYDDTANAEIVKRYKAEFAH